MQHINIKKFALAWGVAGVVFYLGCIILMTTVGREGTILFFNSLLHGLDTSAIVRMDVPWTEALNRTGRNVYPGLAIWGH
ncbi:hypothetical protein BH23BAC2_BH23BAC2_01410 [soil metagenome]